MNKKTKVKTLKKGYIIVMRKKNSKSYQHFPHVFQQLEFSQYQASRKFYLFLQKPQSVLCYKLDSLFSLHKVHFSHSENA